MFPQWVRLTIAIIELAIIVAIIINGLKKIKKGKESKALIVLGILLLFSLLVNQSIFGIIYWDAGPYYGRVLDADTGKPIEGAAVAAIWDFEYFHIKSSSGFANAKETITDKEGRFRLPVIIAFSPWPFSVVRDLDLLVFKPGYDSHPPAIRRKMKKPEWVKGTSTDGTYRIGRWVTCEVGKECTVRLNKARSVKERWRASAKCGSSLRKWDINPSKIKYFTEVIKNEDRYLEMLERQKIK